MAEEGSSKTDKPVIVRVKRKAFQSRLDALWLEINERPLKRPLLDFGKLSISDSSSTRVDELKTKKILVRHVETVVSSEETFDVLRSFMPDSSDAEKAKEKTGGRRNIKTINKQYQLPFKAKQRQEVLSRNARFEQIWKSRKGKKESPEDEAVNEMCRLYDVVRVDVEEQEVKVQKEKETDLEDCKMMAEYLPLLKEVLPTAAVEIEDDIHDCMVKHASSDGYVYDFYAVKEDASMMEADSTSIFPLVQVDDDDDNFYDGPDECEYETDDSNAENNPLNDYPDEETSEEDEDEDEVTSKSSSDDEKSEVESRTSGESGSRVSYEYEEGSGQKYWPDNGEADQFFEDDMYFHGDYGDYDD